MMEQYVLTIAIIDTRDNVRSGKYEPEEKVCGCTEVADLRSFLLPMAEFLYSVK